MHFISSLIVFLAFTFFASTHASPVRCSLHVAFVQSLLYLSFTPQVHLELLNSPDVPAVAVRNENVGLLFSPS